MIEVLEPRVAPAVVVAPNGQRATYTDVDGDRVTIKVSVGDLHDAIFTTAAVGLGEQLQVIGLQNGGFDGASLSVTAAKAQTGDGLVNVGYVNSTGHNLGAVLVKGDLARISTGSGSATELALKSLNVRSMGILGLATQDVAGSLFSSIAGNAGPFSIAGNVDNVFVAVLGKQGPVSIGGSLLSSSIIQNDNGYSSIKISGNLQGGINSDGGIGSLVVNGSVLEGAVRTAGNIGLVQIRGSLQGGSATESGSIKTLADFGSVTIGGSVIGGSGAASGTIRSTGSDIGIVKIGKGLFGGSGGNSGQLFASDKIASISIGGSVIGGSGGDSGQIDSIGGIGPVRIGRDLVGGTANHTGEIGSSGNIASISIGGSIVGGSGNFSGRIASSGDIGAINIGRNLAGVSIGTFGPSVTQSGYIEGTRIASVFIGGSIVSGVDGSGGGDLTASASIRASNDIGSLTVRGGVIGNVTPNGATPVIISARGQAAPSATSDVAIGRIDIRSAVDHVLILGGYSTGVDDANTAASAVNGNAQIGPVTVGGDWRASSIAAGVQDTGNNGFGNADDAIIGGLTNSISKIASILIKGIAIGSGDAGDHFGLVAHQIGFSRIGPVLIPLTAGTDVIELSPSTGDVTMREV